MLPDPPPDPAPRLAPSRADLLLPPALLDGPLDYLRRARLTATLGVLSFLFFLGAATVQAGASNLAAAGLDVFGAVVTVASLLVLRSTGRIVLVVHGQLGLVYAAVMGLALLVRGAGLSGATLVLLVMPVFATLILGPRMGSVWLALSLAGGGALGALGVGGLISDHLSGRVRLLNDHLMLATFTVMLFAVAVVYERRKDEALRQISELEAKRHLAQLGEMRAQAKAELAQAEQFASLGRIAAAAAHELNNPLAYLLANINHVQSNLKPTDDPDLAAALKESLDGAQRIERIVSALGAAAAGAARGSTGVLIADALATAVTLAGPRLASRARLKTGAVEVPAVVGNGATLAEVIAHVLLDAVAAVPEGRVDEHEVAIEASRSGDRVVLEIRATGPGLGKQKKGGGGRLALVLGEAILRASGGTLTAEAASGTTVVRLGLVPAAG